ncbi:hypothetical protein OPV22_027744 [Ensete ventricosum]|uniref:Uncharacterized protein n=1 Tax=Ensete ventricosum TaxID=4639 RepID=A0AAV8P5N2_ENSVE|nr:hypothetical protein OPV22_027744 [Ensete ventricosum]
MTKIAVIALRFVLPVSISPATPSQPATPDRAGAAHHPPPPSASRHSWLLAPDPSAPIPTRASLGRLSRTKRGGKTTSFSEVNPDETRDFLCRTIYFVKSRCFPGFCEHGGHGVEGRCDQRASGCRPPPNIVVSLDERSREDQRPVGAVAAPVVCRPLPALLPRGVPPAGIVAGARGRSMGRP